MARLIGLVMLCFVLAAKAHAADEIAYETQFNGVDGPLLGQLQGVSQLVALEAKPTATESALRRRAESDVDRLTTVVQSAGYYDAWLTYDIDVGKTPHVVAINIETGPRYRLANVVLHRADGREPPAIAGYKPADYGLTLGGPAIAEPVVGAEAKLSRAYAEHGYPFAKVIDRHVIVDTATKTMDVTYILDAGIKATFGPLHVSGLTRLQERYVRRRIVWKLGTPYDQKKVDQTRQALVSSGLFGAVTIEPVAPALANGEIPMRIAVTERALRSVSAGAFYNSSEGLDVNLVWEHRDLFGYGENFKATGELGTSRSGVIFDFRRPDILGKDYDLVANLTFENQLVDAFRALREASSVGLAERLDPQSTAGQTLLAEHARVDEKTDFRTYTLVGVPVFYRHDASNDLLNPSAGYRAGIEATQYWRGLGSNLTYSQMKLNGSTYINLGQGNTDSILAAQLQLGSIFGASLDEIPKDHRFFAGGGGTIRGFAYQKAGPLDQYYNPTGGRSLIVGALEWRRMVTDSIAVVPFVDAGTDSASSFPDPAHKLYLGTGIGVRYLTAVGPVRFDLATPINPHDKGDAPVQVYVSLGQAF